MAVKSGLNRNSMPLPASGSRHDAPTMTSSNKKSVGIISFDARSMPSRTPLLIIRYVPPKMMTVQKMGFTGSAENSAKYVWK